MFGLSEFWGSGFKCGDLIVLCFCLQIGNNNMLKPNIFKMRILTQTKNHKQRRIVATDKNFIP